MVARAVSMLAMTSRPGHRDAPLGLMTAFAGRCLTTWPTRVIPAVNDWYCRWPMIGYEIEFERDGVAGAVVERSLLG
jgi:hypothetical protein